MAIYAIGANYNGVDVSQAFIVQNIAGIGWVQNDAPELHQLIALLKVGDIIYIKAISPNSPDIIVKAVGFILDSSLQNASSSNNLVEVGRNVKWRVMQEFRVPKPQEKNNVRLNSVYEEYHPAVQAAILARL